MRVTNRSTGVVQVSVGPVLLTKAMIILAFQRKIISVVIT